MGEVGESKTLKEGVKAVENFVEQFSADDQLQDDEDTGARSEHLE